MKQLRLLFFAFTLAIGLVAAVPAGAAVDGTEPVTTVAGDGNPGSGAGQVDSPRGVAFDADGNLYVADRLNNRVQKVTPDGTTTTVAGNGGTGTELDELDDPLGVAVGPDGSLYVADTGNDRVVKIAAATTDGTGVIVAGNGGTGTELDELQRPSGVAVDSSGNIYVADTDNARVVKIAAATTDGTGVIVAGNGGSGAELDELSFPEAVVVAPNGDLYVVDTGNARVVMIAAATTDGTGVVVAGNGGNGDLADELDSPGAAALDAEGNLYVADTFNDRIQKIASGVTDGTATTIAGGTGTTLESGDLSFPGGLAFDAEGSMAIADSADAEVLKLTAFDTTDPTITVTGLEDGAVLENGVAVELDFACTDEGTGDLAACTATLDGDAIVDGADLDTETVASHVLVVTATDTAGNEATKTINYRVAGPRELIGAYAAASGVEGTVARLYMAVFARQPDDAGHAYWVATEAAGDATIDDVAQLFVLSEEFQLTYGDLTDEEFVDLLYLNVLGRAGDAEGVEYWNGILDGGAPRSNVVLWFSEGQEFKNLTMTS